MPFNTANNLDVNRISQILNKVQASTPTPSYTSNDPDIEAQLPDPDSLLARQLQNQYTVQDPSGLIMAPSRLDSVNALRQVLMGQHAQGESAAHDQGFGSLAEMNIYQRQQAAADAAAKRQLEQAQAASQLGQGEYYRSFKGPAEMAKIVNPTAQKDLDTLQQQYVQYKNDQAGRLKDQALSKIGLATPPEAKDADFERRISQLQAQVRQPQGGSVVGASTAYPPDLDTLPPGQYVDDSTGAVWEKDAAGNKQRIR